LNVDHDGESILLEQPALNQEEQDAAPDLTKLPVDELSTEQKIVLSAYVNYQSSTLPHKEESTFERIRPYTDACLKTGSNFLVNSKLLMQRSKNEIMRFKHMERSLAQMQELIDKFRDHETLTAVKLEYTFATRYPMSWGIKLELAKNYETVGIHMSAYELVKSAGLDEDAVKYLALAGRQTQAIELAEEMNKNEDGVKNFNIMCLLGEMKRDHIWFQRAWDESNGKCAKAMRNLGRYYFFENMFEKSAECYEKSLALNKLYPASWFTMGCAYMKYGNYKRAIYSFANAVSIDERQQTAWANLANCYMAEKRFFEAVTCCE
jgi:tetratricopeptide (TPR) repeat protein